MVVHPTLAPRADTLWERQGDDPLGSFLSGILGGPGQSTTTTSTTTTPTSTRSSTRTTSSSTTTTTSSTRTTSSSTTTSTTSSILTTSTAAPSTLITTSNFVSGTSTSRVIITSVITPVVTYTAAPTRNASNRSSSGNGALIGGVVGGVIGGLALVGLIIAICILTSRRRSRTGHGYFLCFGQRPNKAGSGDLGHSGGAWPTFDPQDDYGGPGYGSAAAGAGAVGAAGLGAAGLAASRSRRRRGEQTHATLPEQFANEEDPERYGRDNASPTQGDYDGYNNYGGNGGYPDMQEHRRGAAGALAAGAGAGGAAGYYAANNRRSSAGHPSYGGDNYSPANVSPGLGHSEAPPAPWTLPMMGWHDTHGPYSAAGVGHAAGGGASPPQAQFMVSPSEANVAAAAASRPSPGPDYSHFDPPEVRDARAREAANAALARGSFSTGQSHPAALTPSSPRQNHQRMPSNRASPAVDHGGFGAGAVAPPSYVDAQDNFEEMNENPRRLHLTNAEPEMTETDSSQGGGGGGPSHRRRPSHNHKDPPPAATYRRH